MGKEKGRTGGRGRWSAADTVILLLVVLAAAGFVYRAASYRRAGGVDLGQRYEIDFVAEDVHPLTLSDVRASDAVYLYEDDARIGRIQEALAPEGEPHPVTGRVQARGRIDCTGAREEDGSVLPEGARAFLTVGGEVLLRTDRALMKVRITEIRPCS